MVHRFVVVDPNAVTHIRGTVRGYADGLSGIRTHGILLAKEALCR